VAASPLDVRVATAIKAAVDAEGVTFEGPPQSEALVRAMKRFQRENPDLMGQIREWYLRKYAPMPDKDAFGGDFSPDDHYLALWLAEHEHFSALAEKDPGAMHRHQ
jgi:hypothetical protein